MPVRPINIFLDKNGFVLARPDPRFANPGDTVQFVGSHRWEAVIVSATSPFRGNGRYFSENAGQPKGDVVDKVGDFRYDAYLYVTREDGTEDVFSVDPIISIRAGRFADIAETATKLAEEARQLAENYTALAISVDEWLEQALALGAEEPQDETTAGQIGEEGNQP